MENWIFIITFAADALIYIVMATVTTIQRPAEITINVSDLSVAKDISRLLKRVSGITNIRVKKSKTEVELALEEAHKGKVKQWNSVDDYFKSILSE